MADDEKRNNEINSAKKNVKESLELAAKDPSEFRIKNAANALVMADRLVKDPQELKSIRENIENKLPKGIQEQFSKQLNQEIVNIEKWHDKAQLAQVVPSKPTISKTAKAAASQIGKAMNAALKAPGRVGAAIAQTFKGKDKGQSR